MKSIEENKTISLGFRPLIYTSYILGLILFRVSGLKSFVSNIENVILSSIAFFIVLNIFKINRKFTCLILAIMFLICSIVSASNYFYGRYRAYSIEKEYYSRKGVADLIEKCKKEHDNAIDLKTKQTIENYLKLDFSLKRLSDSEYRKNTLIAVNKILDDIDSIDKIGDSFFCDVKARVEKSKYAQWVHEQELYHLCQHYYEHPISYNLLCTNFRELHQLRRDLIWLLNNNNADFEFDDKANSYSSNDKERLVTDNSIVKKMHEIIEGDRFRILLEYHYVKLEKINPSSKKNNGLSR